MNAAPSLITFLSDYGLQDEFVGVCHGVIARRCPGALVIDLTHSVPRHDVRTGACMLAAAMPYLPVGVHLAVVDPGVGATGPDARRAIALRTQRQGRLLVGPDNGLLMPAAQAAGGVAQAVDIGDSRERLEPVSRTFHGRDIFAPVAAALAAGEALDAVGAPLDAGALRVLELPVAKVAHGTLEAHVLRADAFGNVILDARPAQLAELGARPGGSLAVEHAGRSHTARHATAFADAQADELLVYEDSCGMLGLAVNQGSAAQLLGARRDDELALRPG